MTPLKRLREQTGLSAYAFAVRVGIADQYYRALEAGDHEPGQEKFKAIIQGLAELLNRDAGEVAKELLGLEAA